MQKKIIFICMLFSMTIKNNEDTNPYIFHRWQYWDHEKLGLPIDKTFADVLEEEAIKKEDIKRQSIERLEHSKKNPVNNYTAEYRKQAKSYSEEQAIKKINQQVSEYLKISPEQYWREFEKPDFTYSKIEPKTKIQNLEQKIDEEVAGYFDSKLILPYARRPLAYTHLLREPDKFGMKPKITINFLAPRWEKIKKVTSDTNTAPSQNNITHQPTHICQVLQPARVLPFLPIIGSRKSNFNNPLAPINESIFLDEIDGDTQTTTSAKNEQKAPTTRHHAWLYNVK